jgi:hypothetical protein
LGHGREGPRSRIGNFSKGKGGKGDERSIRDEGKEGKTLEKH